MKTICQKKDAADTAIASPILEENSTLEQLEKLRREWEELWRRCPNATPFQSPAWLIPWWEHLGGGKLSVLTVRREGRLVGLAPFFIRVPSGSDQRELCLLGAGVSDYLDVLYESSCKKLCRESILQHLRSHENCWDICEFEELRPGSILLHEAFARDWDVQTTRQSVCPVLKLSGGHQDLSELLPHLMLVELRRCRRRAEKLPGSIIEQAGPENFSELFEGLLRLHTARWAARAQAGALSDRALQEFHREAARRMLADGVLRLYGWRVESQLRAIIYGFTSQKRALFYLSGFDPSSASYSPGTLMIGHALEAAVKEGCVEFDFLRGNEAYKYRWGASDRHIFHCQVKHR